MGTSFGGERTWEPLEQLFGDVPEMVRTYVGTVGDEELAQALKEPEAALPPAPQLPREPTAPTRSMTSVPSPRTARAPGQ